MQNTENFLDKDFDSNCEKAAKALAEADVFLLFTGAGFSADSGLAVYADVARVPAYQARGLDYADICRPDLLSDNPELFYGFWGQCFNDYRNTQPHEGYSILHQWKQDKKTAATGTVAKAISAGIARKVEERRPFDEEIVMRYAPYMVPPSASPAGAFFSFTSNVDSHFHDVFEAQEIHECHGNIESWQCSDPYCPAGVFRAPLKYSFQVSTETMLAPRIASNHNPTKNSAAAQATTTSEDGVAHIGQTGGSRRTQPLKNMPPPKEPNNWCTPAVTPTGTDKKEEIVSSNWPQCRFCQKYARPAVLMFQDSRWKRDIAQGERWSLWKEAVLDLCHERKNNKPLKVCILEIGCGLNVPTCRDESQSMVRDVTSKGGEVVLVRINPSPEESPGTEEDVRPCLIPIVSRGLRAIKKIDELYRAL